MLTIDCEMVGPRETIGELAKKYNLQIRWIKESPNGNLDIRLSGSDTSVELFFREVIRTGETFREWLSYSEVITEDHELDSLLTRAYVYAYAQYEEANKNRELEAESKWDEVFGHIQLAREALAR